MQEKNVCNNTHTQEWCSDLLGISNLCIYWPLDFRKIWHSEGPFLSKITLARVHVTVRHDNYLHPWWDNTVADALSWVALNSFPDEQPELCLPYSIWSHTPPYHPSGCHTVNCYWSIHPWSYLYRLWKGWILFKNPWFHRVCSWSHYVQWIDLCWQPALIPWEGDLRENLYRLAHDNLGHLVLTNHASYSQ